MANDGAALWPKSFFLQWSYLRRRFKDGNTHTQDLRWDQILNLVSSVFTRGCNFNNGGISCHLNAIFGAFLFVFLFSLKRLYLCFHCLLNVFHHYNSPKLLHPLYSFSISKLGIQWIFNIHKLNQSLGGGVAQFSPLIEWKRTPLWFYELKVSLSGPIYIQYLCLSKVTIWEGQ